jgi:zinc transport system substrate-binding protein
MPKRIIFILLALVYLMVGCQKTQKAPRFAQVDILCTFLPVYVMVENVTAGAVGVNIHSLLPASVGCPHNYALTPNDATLLEKADVLVMNGLGMEAFLDGSPYLNRKGLQVIRTGDAVDPIEISSADAHGEHQHAGTAEGKYYNPHAWVSPFAAAKMTWHIAELLMAADTKNAELYQKNAARYATRLDSLGREFKQLAVELPSRGIVTQHEAFDYLARDTGLKIIAAIEPEPGAEPSARYLTELAQTLKLTKPLGIFVEPQYSDRLGKMLSSESGVPVYSLDPAASGDDDPDSYLRIMRGNLEVLKKAVK